MDYRLFLKGSSGRVISAEEFVEEDNAAAIRHALTYDHPHGMELWHRGTMIREFQPDPAKRQRA